MFKKIVSTLLLVVFLFTSITPPAYAQVDRVGPWYDQGFFQFYTRVYDDKSTPATEIYGERYTAAQVQWVMYSVVATAINFFGLRDVATCVMTDSTFACMPAAIGTIVSLVSYEGIDNKDTSNNTGVLASIFSSNKQVSGISYIRQKFEILRLVPEVNAQQGYGYDVLSVVQGLWSASRNISYIFMMIAVIILAFMVMFRVKLSPQTVITAQSAIPKIVFAFLLITFSYAIAGFLIDLMYVTYGLLAVAISNSGIEGIDSSSTNEVFSLMTAGPTVLRTGIHTGILGFMLMYFAQSVIAAFVLLFSSNMFKGMFLVVGILFILAVVLVIIWQLFKISWTLFKATAMVFLLTILAPLQILTGTVIQGQGFGPWVRNFAANLAVFPVVSIHLVLATIFLQYAIAMGLPDSINDAVMDILPFLRIAVPGANLPGLISRQIHAPGEFPPLLLMDQGESGFVLMMMGVSLVFISTASKSADMIKAAMARKPFDYGSAIGQAMMPAAVGLVGAEYGASKLRASVEGHVGKDNAPGFVALENLVGNLRKEVEKRAR